MSTYKRRDREFEAQIASRADFLARRRAAEAETIDPDLGPEKPEGTILPPGARGPSGPTGPTGIIVSPEQQAEIMKMVNAARPNRKPRPSLFRWIKKFLGGER